MHVMEQLPPFAAWRFVEAVDGFEVVYTAPGGIRGHTSAVEAGQPYAVRYDITFDEEWRTRTVRVSADTVAGTHHVTLASDASGRWTVNDEPRPDLDGLIDVDLEASACTNTFPVHRLDADLFHYTSEGGFEAVLRYDDSRLIVDYPGIAVRFA